jgi:hypothetical protein
MCVASKPKIPKDDPATQDKPLPILRNPLLDGLLGNIASLRGGRNALRIDLINPLAIPAGGAVGGGGGGGGSGGSSSSGSDNFTGGGGGDTIGSVGGRTFKNGQGF